MVDKKLLKRFKDAIKSCENNSFIEPDKGLNDLLSCCKEFLKDNDYKVIETKEPVISNVKNAHDLVRLFKVLMAFNHPGKLLDTNPDYHSRRDLRTANLFIKHRMKAGNINRKMAINECANIIKTLVDNMDEVGIKGDINFSIFGQDKLGWITDKTISILNKHMEEGNERNADRLEVEYNDKMKSEVSLGFRDILDNILED